MAENNATTAKPSGKPVINADNTKQHHRMAMGEAVTGTEKVSNGKKTPA